MQSSNNNNIHNWKQRLDDFEESPSIDLNASWEKLQQQAPAKKNTSRKIFYWLAAASVLSAVFLMIGNNDETGKNVEPVIVKADTLPATIENKTLVIEHTSLQPALVQPEKAESKNTQHEAPVVLKNKTATEEMAMVVSLPEEMIHSLSIDTSAKPIVAVKAIPKKLKLVHINEIDPSANKNELVQQEGKPYFPVNYPSKQVYTNAGDNNKGAKDNLIRIKLN